MSIKTYDWFGNPIGLNFDKAGLIHKTALGGAFTILIRLCINIYALFLLKALQLREEDKTVSNSRLVQSDNLGVVEFAETGFKPFIMIQDYYTGTYLKYDDDLKKYINIQMG